jgi:hypothetical protein
MLLSDGEHLGPELVELLLVSTTITGWTASAGTHLGISTALRQNA